MFVPLIIYNKFNIYLIKYVIIFMVNNTKLYKNLYKLLTTIFN